MIPVLLIIFDFFGGLSGTNYGYAEACDAPLASVVLTDVLP